MPSCHADIFRVCMCSAIQKMQRLKTAKQLGFFGGGQQWKWHFSKYRIPVFYWLRYNDITMQHHYAIMSLGQPKWWKWNGVGFRGPHYQFTCKGRLCVLVPWQESHIIGYLFTFPSLFATNPLFQNKIIKIYLYIFYIYIRLFKLDKKQCKSVVNHINQLEIVF